MKHKYYLMRYLCGLQFSSDYFRSFKEADEIRKRQVNPSQWYIVVDPIFTGKGGINIHEVERHQNELLKTAYEALKELQA